MVASPAGRYFLLRQKVTKEATREDSGLPGLDRAVRLRLVRASYDSEGVTLPVHAAAGEGRFTALYRPDKVPPADLYSRAIESDFLGNPYGNFTFHLFMG